MHRRSRSGSATHRYTLQELLQDGTIPHPAGMAHAHSGSTVGTPSRFRAEAERRNTNAVASTSASASLSRSSKGASEDDHLICQSKLYDAYELQGLEQHLDRELSFDHASKTQSGSARSRGGVQRPLLSASDPLEDYRSSGEFLRDVGTRCPCKFCRLHAKTSSLSSEKSSQRNGPYRLPSLSTVSNTEIGPAEEASGSSKRPRAADMSDPARPSLSMPRGYLYRDASAEPSGFAGQDQQELPQAHTDTDRYAKALNTYRLRRRRSRRFPCVQSFCRSMCKKQNDTLINNGDRFFPSNSVHWYKEPWKGEFHHHHTVNHYHQVHHHHHHHLDSGPYFEEIDWPSSPVRLEEPG